MRCLFCQRRIGFFRRFVDREYCSREHKRLMRSQSARAVRALRDEEYEEIWPVSLRTAEPDNRRLQQSNLVSTALFGIFILGALLVGSMGLSGPDGSSRMSASGPNPLEDFRRKIRTHAAVRLRDDFHSGLENWKSSTPAPDSSAQAKTSANDWAVKNGFIHPGRLRLWKDSMSLSDYQLEFVSEIQKKGLGWVYRAQNPNNYYATKIRITKPGPLPTADLMRYAVIQGRENSRISLPLPMVLRSDTLYRVMVNVRGDAFSTTVNGQMVDTWTDSRLRSGGVGFFTDHGEDAALRWVTVSDRDNFVGRVLSYLGFLAPIQPEIYVAILPEL